MINFKNFQNFKKDSSITNKWGELFLPLYLAAVESHLLGFITVFLLFYENFDKIYQEIPCFTPFIHPLTTLIFAF